MSVASKVSLSVPETGHDVGYESVYDVILWIPLPPYCHRLIRRAPCRLPVLMLLTRDDGSRNKPRGISWKSNLTDYHNSLYMNGPCG